jgi:hypothetical protein
VYVLVEVVVVVVVVVFVVVTTRHILVTQHNSFNANNACNRRDIPLTAGRL